jgi:hypothetical protein
MKFSFVGEKCQTIEERSRCLSLSEIKHMKPAGSKIQTPNSARSASEDSVKSDRVSFS